MRALMLIIIFAFFLLPAVAQEEALTPYEIALQRIEEARVSGANRLELYGLGLTELPPEIGQLQNLEILIAWSNRLSDLPSELYGLSNLKYLILWDNRLTEIQPEIANLENLIELDLYQNQLHFLPLELTTLRNLRVLQLGANRLTSIPPEIGNLQNLVYLSLAYNNLSELPVEIAQLENLCHLNLAVNRELRHIPYELGYNRELEEHHCWGGFGGLILDDTNLSSPPREAIEQGTPVILKYLRNEAWWHMQRLIAGGTAFVGVVMSLILGLRWRNRRFSKKKKG